MKTKIEFKSNEEKQNILEQNKDKIVLEEQYLFTGNFLIFSDTKPLENQIKELKETVDILTLKTEGVI